MLKIGDFARLGQVTVRMLRHYDTLGLLVPASVDPWSGYRSYSADQLARLNRLVALKSLGFTLEQVRDLLDADDPARLLDLLRNRQDQLRDDLDAGLRRLADVERRLRLIEREGKMSDYEFSIKALPAVRLADLGTHVDSVDGIGAVMGSMFARLTTAVAQLAPIQGPAVSWYEVDPAQDGMTAHAAWPYAGPASPDFDIVELPSEAAAACLTYVGPIDRIGDAWQALTRWWSDQGLEPTGVCRELSLQEPPADPGGDWVIELQQPVRKA